MIRPAVPYLDEALVGAVKDLGRACMASGVKIVCAESCTAGLISAVLTEAAGSSGWFEAGFVTYTETSKTSLLGVSPETIRRYGVVSEETVSEMTLGALRRTGAGLAVAVSGIAGPGGALPGKPVGTVCFAWRSADGRLAASTEHFEGDRHCVRSAVAVRAVGGLAALLAGGSTIA